MECGDRGEGGGGQVTGRWLHRGETYSVPAGGSHHGPVQTPQCHHSTWSPPGPGTSETIQISLHYIYRELISMYWQCERVYILPHFVPFMICS